MGQWYQIGTGKEENDNVSEMGNEISKDFLQAYEGASLAEIKEELSKVAVQLDSPGKIQSAVWLVALYMNKLQDQFGPMVPDIYVESVHKLTGSVMKYQLDSGLTYTEFQPMAEKVWNEIKGGKIPDLVLYNWDIMAKGTSDVEVPPEYKQLVMNKYKEYSSGSTELQNLCKTNAQKGRGCLAGTLLVGGLVIVLAVLYIALAQMFLRV